MTSRIIYHDFQSKTSVTAVPQPGSGVLLTAAVMAKGRRIAKVNQALNLVCVALCGACIGISSMILCLLFGVLG